MVTSEREAEIRAEMEAFRDELSVLMWALGEREEEVRAVVYSAESCLEARRRAGEPITLRGRAGRMFRSTGRVLRVVEVVGTEG